MDEIYYRYTFSFLSTILWDLRLVTFLLPYFHFASSAVRDTLALFNYKQSVNNAKSCKTTGYTIAAFLF